MNDNFSKEEAKQILENMITDNNELVVNKFITLLNKMSEDKWNELVSQRGLTRENIASFIPDKKRFESLNDLISYGVSGSNIHIHLVPKDARGFLKQDGLDRANLDLIDAINKIKTMLKNDEIKDIENIFAVSPILKIKKLKEMFEKLNFTVNETTSPYLLDKFPNAKSVYQVILTKEKMLTEEWEKNKEKIYNELKEKTNIKKNEDNDLIINLKLSVADDINISDHKKERGIEPDCLEI